MFTPRTRRELVATAPNLITLGSAPLGATLTFEHADGDAQFCRRLSALGLRHGAEIHIVNRTAGGGRVLSVDGSRVAFDRGVLCHLFATSASEEVPA